MHDSQRVPTSVKRYGFPFTVLSTTMCGAASLLSIEISHIAQAVACSVSCAAAFLGQRQFQPMKPIIWRALAASALLFGCAVIVRLVVPDYQEGRQWIELFETFAYLAALIGSFNMVTASDRDRDPTNDLDALIVNVSVASLVWVAVLLPFLRDPSVGVLERSMTVVNAMFALGLVFAATRLALTRSLRHTAGRALALAAICGVWSDALESSTDGTTVISMAFGTIAVGCIGVAALHPTMRRISEPGVMGLRHMSLGYFLAFSATVALWPLLGLVLVVSGKFDQIVLASVLIAGCLVTTLVLFRLTGLIRARERAARLDELMGQLSVELVRAPDVDAVHEIAMKGVQLLVRRGVYVALVYRSASSWKVVKSSGSQYVELSSCHLDGLVDESSRLTSWEQDVDLIVTAVPLRNRHGRLGALVSASRTSLGSDESEALVRVSMNASLAMEAIWALSSRAAADARRQVERDLHDDIQQRLHAIRLRLASRNPDGSPQFEITRIESDLQSTLSALRTISRGQLAPDLTSLGFKGAIEAMVEDLPFNVNVDVAVDNLPDPVAQVGLYIVSESLTNVIKHAGATKIEVSALNIENSLQITVTDNGIGINPGLEGTGIVGMRWRAKQLGGSIGVHSGSSGTQVVALLPREVCYWL